MQYLDDDIDDLFIKAAEGYSVKMPDDWDTIASQLTYNDAKRSSSFNWLKTASVIVLVSALNVLAIELKDSKLIVTANKTILSNNISNIVKNEPTKLATTTFKVSNSLKVIYNAPFVQEVTDYLSASRLTLFNRNNKLITSDYSQKNQSTPAITLVPINDTNSNNDVEKNKLITIITNKKDTAAPNALTLNEEISTGNKNVATITEVKKTSNKFYLGLQAGISFNQIKSQGFTKHGYNIGVIVGKAFNKNWALESGIILTNKSYYTDGQYFNKTKAASSMPAGFKVKSLDGNCTLLEVPLTVKLNFRNKKNKGSFYTNAGIATYITISEHNNYFASINGGTPINVEASYNDKAYQVLGALQLGFGYENKISNKINIRVEPYLQIPLSGIGIGALPVTTAGLRIGFTNNR
jgi:hypothetical protein